jgi:hypothetical protein
MSAATGQHRRSSIAHRLGDERGIALIMAIGVLLVMAIAVASMTGFTTLNRRSAQTSNDRLGAQQYAESGMNAAYNVLSWTLSSGQNASAANLLGCAGATGPADSNGPSNCAAPTPKVFCVTGAPTCAVGQPQTVSVYGYFSGATGGSYLGATVPPSTWLIIATGYAWNSSTDTVISQTARAQVTVKPLGAGAVAAVWNHVFITAPLTPNVCALTMAGNSVVLTVPLYVIGNMCLGSNGSGTVMKETTQPVDLQVGGKLILVGGSSIGADAQHPITSGVVVGGCSTVSVSSTTTPCTPTGLNYWVKTPETFVLNDAPALSPAQAATKYATADPGPKHLCAAGNNPNPPLAASAFDNDTALNLTTEPNVTAASFELTPNFSYSCISQNGAAVGQLSWDNTTKQLTINGSIFFDGNLTISQSGTYTGTAAIEAAGTIVFNGNNLSLCATLPCNTSSNAWQGSSGNNSMLTLVALAANTRAIVFQDNSQTFQGSLWTQPSSVVAFVKNTDIIEGPISVGGIDSVFNNATLIPLPLIVNMPVGAPLPPNSSVSLGTLTYVQ